MDFILFIAFIVYISGVLVTLKKASAIANKYDNAVYATGAILVSLLSWVGYFALHQSENKIK